MAKTLVAPDGPASRLYDEILTLLRDTKQYFDSGGRAAETGSGRVFAQESVNLTARLADMAGWVVVRIEAEQIGAGPVLHSRRFALRADPHCLEPLKADTERRLPPQMVSLLARSLSLYRRVERLDQAGPLPAGEQNPWQDRATAQRALRIFP